MYEKFEKDLAIAAASGIVMLIIIISLLVFIIWFAVK